MSTAIPFDTFSERTERSSLTSLAQGQAACIVEVVERRPNMPRQTIERLHDLGFVPGELVHVLARGPLGGEPIAVRVGTSTFALRSHEADCILIASLD